MKNNCLDEILRKIEVIEKEIKLLDWKISLFEWMFEAIKKSDDRGLTISFFKHLLSKGPTFFRANNFRWLADVSWKKLKNRQRGGFLVE